MNVKDWFALRTMTAYHMIYETTVDRKIFKLRYDRISGRDGIGEKTVRIPTRFTPHFPKHLYKEMIAMRR